MCPKPKHLKHLISLFHENLHIGFQKHTIHGNLKSKNILLDRNYHPYISDFSPHLLLYATASQEMLEAAESYKALELIKVKDASKETDIYSLGVILLELISGIEPINENPTPEIKKLSIPQYSKKMLRDVLAEIIITNEMPFTTVDKACFYKFVHTLEPRFPMPRRR
ncbi:probable leucine-rich repeat receptor-like protein kinase IMK3 [Juglans regia]|uniref:Probable leucine-rich repeat receptor-like protein kinase IMK3 n=1 Tax=Juglans regia TaxID=51240 RepID=A0A6P9EUB8_JUGRE|nr:probable leucine-rich repeat receptor-like protein kinase IMK3 [Juglans regia]